VAIPDTRGLRRPARRIADVAIERLSNREIAQALFVTVKTVDAYVNHVFRKLDMDSMKELESVMAQAVRTPSKTELAACTSSEASACQLPVNTPLSLRSNRQMARALLV
jgi:DNA-binding CsgD family transcriptional regulator